MPLSGYRPSQVLVVGLLVAVLAAAPAGAERAWQPLGRAQMAEHLRRNGVAVAPRILRSVAGQYARQVREPVGRFTDASYASPDLAEVVIGLHRAQLGSRGYLQARGPRPKTGTLDPVHAEDTASLAERMGAARGFRGDDLRLLRVAAHLHDADRSFPSTMVPGEEEARGDPAAYERYKAAHMRSSVARARELLAQARRRGARASPAFERDLTYLIGRHELGGRPGGGRLDELADVLRDADSTAFFSTNIVTYLAESGGDEGKLEQKIETMLSRMNPANRRWVVDHVVRSPTHLLGRRGVRAGDPGVRRTAEILADLALRPPSIARLDAWLRARADGWEMGREPVGKRTNLTRVTYAAGGELLHTALQGDKGSPRGVLERAVHLTARHLNLPLRVAPPAVRHGDVVISPWIPGVRNVLDGDWKLTRELGETATRHPERIDWESVHALLILDHVTAQTDRTWNNIFVRERRGKLSLIALDNELTFGHTAGWVQPLASSQVGLLVRNSLKHAPATRLSPRLARGLRSIDVAAWRADLGRAGLGAAEIDAATTRLREVQAKGLGAIFFELSR